MDPDSGHRPIELQAPEDFTYLINNVRRAAAEHINAAFPPVEGQDGQEDELRVRIEQLVYDYIRQTFTLASPNLTINGLPVAPEPFLSSVHPSSGGGASPPPPPEEHYEPFDARKRQRVQDLAREEEALLSRIAALKRRVPGAAAARHAEAFRAALRADEEALEAARQRAVAEVAGPTAAVTPQEDGGDGDEVGAGGKTKKVAALPGKKRRVMIDVAPLERQEKMEEAYAGAVKTLGRLKREMPATVAKMERARAAGEYVVTQR
ncbi:hypothetical protein NKR23_g4845 [Pleurostoma richardsiae]|uniref:Kinetochore protein n=1 Tax=Pleurostoma richardsiae TaxID=41990 RepID=A0AA38RU55_9PEZI|nr:hypothetical protein NKR23_g4845 [Pleurostoma richardsiae]